MTVKTKEKPLEPAASERPSARDRLLAAANELFYAEGVHVVGVDRIVERASLYNAFGSKDELVRAYLERHFLIRQNRIARILAAHTDPRERLLAVFAEVEDMLAGTAFRGCKFISAAAESRSSDASVEVAEKYRAWLWNLFTDLAKAAGAIDPKQFGRQLFLLYDGAAIAARMDKDRSAAAKAMRSAVVSLLDAAIRPKSGRRAP